MYDAFYFEFPELCSVSYDWFLWFPILDKPLTALISVQKSSAECLWSALSIFVRGFALWGDIYLHL